MLFDATVLMTAGTILVFLGIASIALSKNLVKTVMAFQVMLFGANLAIFASGLDTTADVTTRWMSDAFVLISVMVGAAVESVGLAIVVMVYRKYGTLNPSKIRRLKH